MATAPETIRPGGFRPEFHPRILGTPAPVFPGFEFDFLEKTDDREKPDAVWHRERAKQMVDAHPEIRKLFGPVWQTAVWCVVLATAQIGVAMLMSGQPFWVVLVTAYVVGALVNTGLFMLAHECNHNLVFKKTSWNLWMFTFTSLPMFLTGHHTWWLEHHTHHSDLGSTKDFIKRRRSFLLCTRIVSPLWWPFSLIMIVTQVARSVLGLAAYAVDLLRGRWRPSPRTLAILTDVHLARAYEKHQLSFWAIVYPLLSLAMIAGLWMWGGWQPLVYLLFSSAFLTGFLHPLLFGMILSNSHFHGFRRYQPTSSYYGWLNAITFNFGLHTEHHDLCRVAWNRLPELRRLAPEYYDNLGKTRSYVALAFQFVCGDRTTFEDQFNNEELRNAALLGTVSRRPKEAQSTA